MSAAAKPLVSVLMPCFNAGIFLREALASVLAQTYDHWELLVIDDGSTDGAVQAAQCEFLDSRIRWFRHENRGKPATMNFALAELRGEYYAVQDADDVSNPQRLETLVEALRADATLAGCFSGHDLIIDGRNVAPIVQAKSAERCRQDINNMRMPAHDPTAMYRVSLVKEVLYDPQLRQGEGIDYILRIGERHPLAVLGDCLYSYRVHPHSLTREDPVARMSFVQEALNRARVRRGLPECFAPPPRAGRSHNARNDNGLPAHFMRSVQSLCNKGCRASALVAGLYCARLHPCDPEYLKPLAVSLAPRCLRSRLRSFS